MAAHNRSRSPEDSLALLDSAHLSVHSGNVDAPDNRKLRHPSRSRELKDKLELGSGSRRIETAPGVTPGAAGRCGCYRLRKQSEQ